MKTVHGAISEALGEAVDADTGLEALRRLCDRAGVPYTDDDGRGDVILEMYERLVEERTRLPTFYKDFPTDVSPLTRQHRTDPGSPSAGTSSPSAPNSAPPTPS